MGYHKVQDQWVKRVSGQRVRHPDSSSDSEEQAEPAPETDTAAATDRADTDDDRESESSESSDDDAPPLVQTGAQFSSPMTPPGPSAPGPSVPGPSAPPTSAADTSSQSFVTMEQLTQFGDSLVGRISSIVGDLRQSLDTGLQMYREDMRALTLRVETLELSQRTQEDYRTDLRDLRSDFGRLRGEASSFAARQTETMEDIQHGTHQMRAELGAVLLGFTGASSAFGASSSSQPPRQPPPHATPRPRPPPSSSRPPFSANVRPGTGFPPVPPPRTGPSSRTRSARGPPPFRSPRVYASETLNLDSSSESD